MTKAERVREEILNFVKMMEFKYEVKYYSCQVSFKGDDEKMQLTGLITGSNAFLNAAVHQIEEARIIEDQTDKQI